MLGKESGLPGRWDIGGADSARDVPEALRIGIGDMDRGIPGTGPCGGRIGMPMGMGVVTVAVARVTT